MFQPVYLTIRQQACWLSPHRCLYWEDAQTLVTGGFQLGRYPSSPENATRISSLDRLQEQILFFKAARVLFIGGFPLPENNQYLEQFIAWRNRFQSLTMEFVLSRSSPVAESLLLSLGAKIQIGSMEEGPFYWIASRIAEEKWISAPGNQYMISGYQDPGFRKYGIPRNQAGIPAFYFTPAFGVLPAFSRSMGALPVKPGKDELVWLAKEKELELKN